MDKPLTMRRGVQLAGIACFTAFAGGCDDTASNQAAGTDLAAQRYLAAEEPGEIDLQRLASAGPDGHDAGAAVMRQLESDNWHLRATAAFTLGSIRYVRAEGRLLQALEDPADPLLNRTAAEALGRLGDPAALDALRRASASHWRTSVRVAATQAIRHIRDRSPYPPVGPRAGLDDDAMDNGLNRCTEDLFLYSRNQPEEQTFAVVGGRLVGIDLGEWGGNLRFEAASGAIQPLLDRNIFKLITLGGRMVAVTGFLHLGAARGAIYDVSRDTTGTWHAAPWRGMDGPPMWTVKARDGSLHVGLPTYTLLLRPDGTMEERACETPAEAAGSAKL
jgi:hypothetical protein